MKKPSSSNPNIRLVQSKQSCGHCDIEHLCISAGMHEESDDFNEIVKTSDSFDARERIFKRSDPVSSLYVIQSGAAKSQTTNADGRHQVVGFYFPGDLVGIETIAIKKHPCDVFALEKTWLCEVPFESLETLCGSHPSLQHELFMRMGERIYHDEYSCLLRRDETADKRVLSFITELYKKLEGSKYIKGASIHLPMTKTDLSSYLGLQPETLSRTLKQLQAKGYIVNSASQIEILDFEGINHVVQN